MNSSRSTEGRFGPIETIMWPTILCMALVAAKPVSVGESAEAAFRAKEYAKAAALFEKSALETGRGQAWYNAGLAYYKAALSAKAMRAYTLAHETGGVRSALLSELNQRMTELRGRVAELRLSVASECEITVDGVAETARVWLEPGLHQVVSSCGGQELRRETLTLIGGEFREVRVEAPARQATTAPVIEPTPVARVLTPNDVVTPAAVVDKPQVVSRPRQWHWLVSSIGAGGLAVGGAIATGLFNASAESTYQQFLATAKTDVLLSQRGQQQQLGFGVSLAATITVATFSVVALIIHFVTAQ
jgi:hypothetical protein